MMAAAKLFILSHGAAWVLPDGRVIKIPGFHSSWLASHAAIAGGAANTGEFVKKSGWVSAVLHEGGYLELIQRTLGDSRQRDCLWGILSSNAEALERVVVMVLDKEDHTTFLRPMPGSREEFEARLAAPSEA